MLKPISQCIPLISYAQNHLDPSFRISSTAIRNEQPYIIPSDSPSYDSVIARSMELGLNHYLKTDKYSKNLRLILPNEDDWTYLCEFDDYCGVNINSIDKESHLSICKKIFSYNLDLFCWIHRTANQERNNSFDLSIQYQALSLDWSRSYYRRNYSTTIPTDSFNWRNVVSPEDISLSDCDEKAEEVVFPSSSKKKCSSEVNPRLPSGSRYKSVKLMDKNAHAKQKLVEDDSVSINILKKTLEKFVLELENTVKHKDIGSYIKFKADFDKLMAEVNIPTYYSTNISKAILLANNAKELVKSGKKNPKCNYNIFSKNLLLYIRKS